jgi:predicted dehydrogenase
MNAPKPTSRRRFLKSTATAGAALAVGANRAPAVLANPRPNETLGVAMIGVGTQGHRLLQAVQAVENTEVRVICDLYTGNIRRAQGLCANDKVRIVREWERVVEDEDIDAVVVAIPDFMHARMTVAAAQNKKDVYVEKGWCVTLDEAKRMRVAVKDNKVVMQLGHHMNSVPAMHKAREIFRSGALGKVPLVRTYIDRSSSFPVWQFYTDYSIQELPKDATPENIDWKRFVANSPSPDRPFDPERFFTWRRYWDYGTGIAGDLLTHMWDAVNMVMEMGIPETAVTQGGKYFWKEDREVPDMWHVLFDYPKKELAVTFGCSFHNAHVGELIQFLGRDLTMECASESCRTYTPEWKPGGFERVMAARDLAEETRRIARERGVEAPPTAVAPDYSYREGELRVSSHLENFFDCVRSRELPRCHVDRAFEEAVALLMSLEAYRRDAKVRWDPVKEEIV